MRKIKSYFFVSLDGVVESPDKWHFPYFDDEMGAVVSAGFATSDAMLMGRVLYDEWAAYWPEHGDEPFGDASQTSKTGVLNLRYAAAKDWRPGPGDTKLRREQWPSPAPRTDRQPGCRACATTPTDHRKETDRWQHGSL